MTDLEDVADGIGSSGLTSSQAASLDILLQNVAASGGTDSYVYSILGEVVACGGSAGSTQTQFNAAVGQWFLGTNNPTPLPGATLVSAAGSALFPTDIATAYEAVDQGYFNGDCWLVSALIETDAVNPVQLASMIWQNDNGSYGVRFCSPAGYQYLTVDADLMSNNEGAYSTDGSIWAGLLEKAFVEAQADGLSFPMSDNTNFTTSYVNNYGIIAGGGWDQMMKAITGRQTNYYQLSQETALSEGGAIYDQILSDTENGIDVLLSSYTDTSYGLRADHMFAVTGIDQQTGNYILFNPWGSAETSDTQFEVTPADLYTLYQDGSGDQFLAADGAYYTTATSADPTLCHLAGTAILTPEGERPIEALRIGDEVMTRFSGVQRIKWIGEQHYSGRFIATNRNIIPVKIAAGALGDDLPRRDLYLSPGHSVLLDDVLIVAQDLVNGVTITQGWVPDVVSYYNIELEHHDCVLAQGSWSETYADCADQRRAFHNARSYWALYPEQPAPAHPVLCAPRPRTGAPFNKILSRILMAAEAQTNPGASFGFVEEMADEVTGWAFDAENPDLPVRLYIYAGKAPIGQCFAHEDRPDVRDAGFGAGRCGFRYKLPASLYTAIVTVRRAASGEILPPVDSLVLRRRA